MKERKEDNNESTAFGKNIFQPLHCIQTQRVVFVEQVVAE